jgi:hypothetical protein
MDFKNILLTIALGGLLAGTAMAQNPNVSGAGPGVYDPGHPRVNEIKQRRIANGVRSGELTPRETRHVEREEHRLKRNERRDMARDGGHLTKADQARLNREANHINRNIYRDKHNPAVR